MSTYPAAEGLQVDNRPVSEQQEKILASPTWKRVLEKNDKVPMGLDQGGDIDGGGEGMEALPDMEKRYCGLSRKQFWLVLIVLLLIIVAGAVGGGVGGSVAGKPAVENSNASTSTSSFISTTAANNTTLPSTSVSPFTTTRTSSVPTSAPKACPPALKCSDIGCLGLNSPSNPQTGGRCLSGLYNQCPCISVCPASPKPCPQCNGSSKTLICGTGDFLGCACTSVCGAVDGPCGNCAGKSDPNGGPGICTSMDVKDCNCASECGPVNGRCDLSGCFGNNGFCTQGKYWGCGCG